MRPETAFHLYVHWPYCRSKCAYCDFASVVPRRGWDAAAFVAAYRADIAALRGLTGARRLGSVFFGGGTPSLAEPSIIGAVVEAAAQAWEPAADLEVTLEANPGTVDRKALIALRDAGVNRLSVGAQSFDAAALAALGRAHSVDETKHALTWAHDVFERLSMDLIAARPGQTAPAWAAELAEALDFAGEHVSVYQLTVEEGTPLAAAVAAGRVTMPDEETAAEIFELTRRVLAASGRPAYEISNFARPGAECRHNLAIWRGADYGGVGPAAHGRLTVEEGFLATRHAPDAADWLAGPPAPQRTPLAAAERAREHLMMSLRLTEGVSFARFAELFAPRGLPDAAEFLDAEALDEAIGLGLICRDERGVRVSEAGTLLLNALTARVLR
jgi:oxygen-independent coproporphyrinogen-3 oxidase